MGCLLFPFELIFDGIIYLIQKIVPEKAFSKGVRNVLEIFVNIFIFLLLLSMLLGVFALISDDEYTNYIGKFMFFIPLWIALLKSF